MSDPTTPTIRIRVVKPPTTAELLDDYYRRNGMIHGSRRPHGPVDPREASRNPRAPRLGRS